MSALRRWWRGLFAGDEARRALLLDELCEHQDIGACVDCENRFICENGP